MWESVSLLHLPENHKYSEWCRWNHGFTLVSPFPRMSSPYSSVCKRCLIAEWLGSNHSAKNHHYGPIPALLHKEGAITSETEIDITPLHIGRGWGWVRWGVSLSHSGETGMKPRFHHYDIGILLFMKCETGETELAPFSSVKRGRFGRFCVHSK